MLDTRGCTAVGIGGSELRALFLTNASYRLAMTAPTPSMTRYVAQAATVLPLQTQLPW